MEILLNNLSKLTRLPEAELVPILHHFLPRTIKAGVGLLTPGAISTAVWFIGTGALRAFYHVEERRRKDGAEFQGIVFREVTTWIVPAGGFLTDVKSFLRQTPGLYHIEALEPCSLYSLSYNSYMIIQHDHPYIARAIFENTLIMADLRMQMCNLRYPEDRLAMFENMYPGMTGRLSVNIQASYLNIDPSTLSRLRGKRSKNNS